MIRLRKSFFLLTLAGTVQLTLAQSIYDTEALSTHDLHGTARYVGMGGALGALGADISTMGSNPAGIGLYKRTDIALSAGLWMQAQGTPFADKGKNRLSFDQLGFVYSTPAQGRSIIFNYGFNYQKTKNFSSLLNAAHQADAKGGASMTWEMADLASYWTTDKLPPWGKLGYEVYLIDDEKDPVNKPTGKFLTQNALRNKYNQRTLGGIQQYDFNFSANVRDRYFLGLTISAYNVDRDTYSEYAESYLNPTSQVGEGDFVYSNDEQLSGYGFDIKLGAIVRPFVNSPFRLGLAVTTPTWYAMEMNNYAKIAHYPDSKSLDMYDKFVQNQHTYNLTTPWRFNFSLGHTVGNYLALGAEYEYVGLSSARVGYTNGYDYTYDIATTTQDKALNNEIKSQLRGVSTLKLGAEVKASSHFAIRAGYNYVTTPIKSQAYYNQFINSASVDYTTQPAYANLSDIHRVTCGIGFRAKAFYADLSMQYQTQSASFYPFFAGTTANVHINEVTAHHVKLDKTQLLLTLGFKL